MITLEKQFDSNQLLTRNLGPILTSLGDTKCQSVKLGSKNCKFKVIGLYSVSYVSFFHQKYIRIFLLNDFKTLGFKKAVTYL